MTSETTIYPQGTLARLTRTITGFGNERERPQGFEFEVEDFVSAEEAEDGTAFYWGSAGGGCNNVAVPADAVELVRTAKQQASRKLPTIAALSAHLRSALLSDGEYFRITETMPDGSSDVEVYGRTEDDLPFGFRVRVTGVWRTDD